MTVREKIKAKTGDLTAAEATFADYVLNHEDLIYKSISLATEESGAGYGTVVRFCQKMGYSGFQDFKIHLAMDAGAGPAEKEETSGPGWIGRRAQAASRQIAATAETLGDSSLKAAAELIAKARFVLAIGAAGSFPVAKDLSYRLDRIGLTSRAEPDSHLEVIKSSLLGKKDLLFAVSSSGGTKEILDCARLARARGASVIALTSYAKSPLAEEANIVLTTAIWEGALQAELGTKLPFFFVVELLSSLLLRIVPSAEESLRLSSECVASKQF